MKSVVRNIYDIHLNSNTYNFGGLEWVVDGDMGRMVYPGTWAECTARAYYRKGCPYNKPAPDLRTYIIMLDGLFYAIAMDLFATTVWSLQREGAVVTNIKTVEDRNAAIREVAQGFHNWKSAHDLACESGMYCGQLYEK